MSDYRSDIVILTALEMEFRQLQRVLGEQKLKRSETDPAVYSGTLRRGSKAFAVYAAHQPSYGMTSAAILATRLIKQYRPRYLVMVGIAAGFKKNNSKCGDIIIASYAVNYQEGKVGRQGFSQDGIGVSLASDMCLKFQDSMNDIMAELNDRPGPKYDAYLGAILTGSQVVNNIDIMTHLKDHVSRKAVGLDMEGVAIFQAAEQACGPGKPIAIVIKGVSDLGHRKPDAVRKGSTAKREIAAYNSARFFVEFMFRELEPERSLTMPKRRNVEVVPRDELGPERGPERLIEALGRCTKGSRIRLISITGASVLAPPITTFNGGREEKTPTQALKKALDDGAHCQAIVLAPHSKEAEVRIAFESPGMKPDQSMLRKGSKVVRERLLNQHFWGHFLGKQLEVRYSEVGLAFGLWMFDQEARIEPYHYGKLKKNRGAPEWALCSFSHVWISKPATELELLENHFDKLWNSLHASKSGRDRR